MGSRSSERANAGGIEADAGKGPDAFSGLGFINFMGKPKDGCRGYRRLFGRIGQGRVKIPFFREIRSSFPTP